MNEIEKLLDAIGSELGILYILCQPGKQAGRAEQRRESIDRLFPLWAKLVDIVRKEGE